LKWIHLGDRTAAVLKDSSDRVSAALPSPARAHPDKKISKGRREKLRALILTPAQAVMHPPTVIALQHRAIVRWRVRNAESQRQANFCTNAHSTLSPIHSKCVSYRSADGSTHGITDLPPATHSPDTRKPSISQRAQTASTRNVERRRTICKFQSLR